MKPHLHLDFETRSTQELGGSTSVGLHNYAIHESTIPLMLAYAYGESPVQLWEPRLGFMPDDLRQGLEDSKQLLIAWNSSFERHILEYKFGIKILAERFVDPQPSARYLSLPGSLDTVGEILNLPSEFAKDKKGEDLIKLFSVPHLTKKKKGETQTQYFNDWNTHPEEWQLFGDYCKRDIVAEREITRRLTLLKVFPLPELESRIWAWDQKCNDRGMPVDRKFVENMYALGTRSKTEAVEKQNKLTGLENANSNTQLLAWAQTQGYEPNSLNKNTVEAQIKYHSDTLTPLCIEVLEARRAASSTTYKKLAAILRQVSPDGRLRGQFLYMGSARCGRWSGAGVQLHNMARPGIVNGYDFEDQDVVKEAREMVRQMDYDGIQSKFGSVLLVIKNLIRTIFAV